jgi:hypothetical protein
MKLNRSCLPTSLVVALIGASCGGENPTSNPPPVAATATPTPAASATATPTPGATTAPSAQQPNEDEHPGPVASARVRLYAVANRPPNQGGEVRPGPYYDPVSDTDVVRFGEFLVLDTTAFNTAGQKCQTQGRPQWTIENPELFEILGNGGNPFLIRANARRRGTTAVYATVDGFRTNVINIEIR